MYVKLSKAGIFYNDREKFEWSESNFPDKKHFGIKPKMHLLWQVKQVEYDSKNQFLKVSPIDYRPSNSDAFHSQAPKKKVRQIVFEHVDWEKLEPLFYRYKRSAFDGLLLEPTEAKAEGESTEKRVTDRPGAFFKSEVLDHADTKSKESTEKEDLLKRKVSRKYKVKLQDLKFKNGYVEYFAQIFDHIHTNIRIYNDHLIEEFDHIKPYFSKTIGKKYALIEGYFILRGFEVLEKHFHSTDLAGIDEESYTTIKNIVIHETPNKTIHGAIDKSLFTNEDLLDTTHGDDIGNTLKTTEAELFEQLIGEANVRNRKQLIYLAGKIHHPKIKLRFTLKPDFGFVFCHRGRRMIHFIWELLDSNATYLWSTDYDRSEDQLLEEIEDIIGFIQNQGRKIYLQSDKHDRFVFQKIIHRTKGIIDSFPRWKQELNAGLI